MRPEQEESFTELYRKYFNHIKERTGILESELAEQGSFSPLSAITSTYRS